MSVDALADIARFIDHTFTAATAFWTGLGVFSGWIIAWRMQARVLERGHNFAAISQITGSSSQAMAYAQVFRFIANHPAPVVPVEDIKKETGLEEQAIIILATHTFLSVAARDGYVNRGLVRDFFLPSMVFTFSKLGSFIAHYRKMTGRSGAWRELQDFIERGGHRSRWRGRVARIFAGR